MELQCYDCGRVFTVKNFWKFAGCPDCTKIPEKPHQGEIEVI
jgi:predicted  nucleic acid-binding Zn-ribbon protein